MRADFEESPPRDHGNCPAYHFMVPARKDIRIACYLRCYFMRVRWFFLLFDSARILYSDATAASLGSSTCP